MTTVAELERELYQDQESDKELNLLIGSIPEQWKQVVLASYRLGWSRGIDRGLQRARALLKAP